MLSVLPGISMLSQEHEDLEVRAEHPSLPHWDFRTKMYSNDSPLYSSMLS